MEHTVKLTKFVFERQLKEKSHIGFLLDNDYGEELKCAVGDTLVFKELLPDGFSGREIKRKVTFMVDGFHVYYGDCKIIFHEEIEDG